MKGSWASPVWNVMKSAAARRWPMCVAFGVLVTGIEWQRGASFEAALPAMIWAPVALMAFLIIFSGIGALIGRVVVSLIELISGWF